MDLVYAYIIFIYLLILFFPLNNHRNLHLDVHHYSFFPLQPRQTLPVFTTLVPITSTGTSTITTTSSGTTILMTDIPAPFGGSGSSLSLGAIVDLGSGAAVDMGDATSSSGHGHPANSNSHSHGSLPIGHIRTPSWRLKFL
ncbi:hypothetical protein VKT23_020053 [Stygiomarasmius scandens]|uniref:Uncharacterized protein n=1 Tax=Marasmiellus scandens TaxID=2682957 RepID=A0ABR1IMK0_9AGAR